MNLFNENKTNSPSTIVQTCTSCCPLNIKNFSHPQINYPNEIISNSNLCCLNKLQVDCRIQCQKKKKTKLINNSIHSSRSTKRSISSSSSQLSDNRKRHKFNSNTNTNSHYIHNYDFDTISSSSTTDESEIIQQSKNQSPLEINQNIQDLKISIDNLTQLIIGHQNSSNLSTNNIPSISFIDKIRRFFNSSSNQSKDVLDINEECYQILERNHLTKEKLISIYYLFDKNETIFLNWLRTIMPEYFLPLLLNYVKYFNSISTDKK